MANTYTPNTKHRQPAAGDFDWDDEVNGNSSINDVVFAALKSKNRIISGLLVSDGGSLDADYTTGVVDSNGTRYTPAASSILMTASSMNWIYVNSSGVVSTSTSEPTGEFALMALVDTDATSILRIADLRTFGYTKIQLENGISINEFSSDGTMAGDSDLAVPTEKAVKAYADSIYSNKNLLLNPDFNQNQYEYPADDVVTLADNTYGHDMWMNRTGSTQKYYIDGSGNIDLDAIELGQKNDLILAVNGETVTFSIGAGEVQIYGLGVATWTNVTAASPHTWTLDTSGNSGWLELKISGTNTFKQPKLEIGSIATKYVPRDKAAEAIKCNHYLWISGLTGNYDIRFETSRNTANLHVSTFFPVEMRAVPTCTSTLLNVDSSAATSVTAAPTAKGVPIWTLNTSPGAGTYRFGIRLIADAAYYA